MVTSGEFKTGPRGVRCYTRLIKHQGNDSGSLGGGGYGAINGSDFPDCEAQQTKGACQAVLLSVEYLHRGLRVCVCVSCIRVSGGPENGV